MDKKEEKRISVFVGIILFISIIILFRFAWIMVFTHNTENPEISDIAEGERGSIMDRNGRLLAMQTQLYSVEAWKPNITEPEETASLLASILDLDQGSLYEDFTRNRSANYLFIKRMITPSESEKIKQLLDEKKLEGISLKPELARNYPEKSLTAHLTGYTGIDNTGLDGIEYTFNESLIPPETGDSRQNAYGNNIYLTIDLNTQYLVDQIARKAFEENDPDSMMVMVMDAKNADILSYVSLPSFDPNNLNESTTKSRLNRPVAFTYEPGSVFKIFSIASFLELGGIGMDDSFDTTGGYNPEIFTQYDIRPITDLGNYGVLTPESILIYSSNVGVAYASETVEKVEFYNILKNFGFGKTVGIPLPGESAGIFNQPENWSVRTKPTLAMGQEVGVSAVQMLAASTVFANSGVLLKPHIVKKIESADGQLIKEFKREPVREVISPEIADNILLMMEKVVSSPYGTARRARIEGLRISAKSGTAQRFDPETGTYSDENFIGSVLAIFPTENPRLIVYVVLIDPKGVSYYGGRIASPIVKEIAETLAPLYGIPLEGNTVSSHPGKISLSPRDPLPVTSYIPDFSSYSKREVLQYFKESGLSCNIKGDGWVIYQFPPPGTEIDEIDSVFLELK